MEEQKEVSRRDNLSWTVISLEQRPQAMFYVRSWADMKPNK